MVYIKCEDCGDIVSGNSQAHAEANLEIHRKSKRHIKVVNIESSQAIVLSGAKVVKPRGKN